MDNFQTIGKLKLSKDFWYIIQSGLANSDTHDLRNSGGTPIGSMKKLCADNKLSDCNSLSHTGSSAIPE